VQANGQRVTAPIEVVPGVSKQMVNGEVHTSTAVTVSGNKTTKLDSVPNIPVFTPKDFQQSKTVVQPKKAQNWDSAKEFNITVIKDGDTFAGNFAGTRDTVTCRVTGVDAPESPKAWKDDPGQPFGAYATSVLKKFVEQGKVSVQISLSPQDQPNKANYFRNVCLVTVKGHDLSAALVEQGAAYVYEKYVKAEMEPALNTAQQKAKEAKRGVWSQDGLARPDEYRHGSK
jgi:endonuclease YncB( thermonuclease family)